MTWKNILKEEFNEGDGITEDNMASAHTKRQQKHDGRIIFSGLVYGKEGDFNIIFSNRSSALRWLNQKGRKWIRDLGYEVEQLAPVDGMSWFIVKQ